MSGGKVKLMKWNDANGISYGVGETSILSAIDRLVNCLDAGEKIKLTSDLIINASPPPVIGDRR